MKEDVAMSNTRFRRKCLVCKTIVLDGETKCPACNSRQISIRTSEAKGSYMLCDFNNLLTKVISVINFIIEK